MMVMFDMKVKVRDIYLLMYLQKKVMTPKEIQENLVLIVDENSPDYVSVKKWVTEFKGVKDSIEYGPRPGLPKL